MKLLNSYLSQPRKLLFVAIFIVVIIIMVYLIRKWVRGEPMADTIKDVGKEIKPSQLSYSDSQYATYADRLEQAFHDIGTDEQAVYNVMGEMKTDSDVKALVKAYGIRRKWDLFWPMNLNLTQTIYNEMTQKEIDRINEILAGNGLTYKF